MKKNVKKPLALATQTVRSLQLDNLAPVAGGQNSAILCLKSITSCGHPCTM